MTVATQTMTDEQRKSVARDWKIQRCFIYPDPDYAGGDTERYPWLTRDG